MEENNNFLQVGSLYMCTNNYYRVIDGTPKVIYRKGNIYSCDIEGCITTEDNDMHYHWTDSFAKTYFTLFSRKGRVINEQTNETIKKESQENTKVNHPPYYTWLKEKCGIEVIDITRHLSFNRGNAVKYLLRAGYKAEKGYSKENKTIEDLKKAIWYIEDEIKTLEKQKYE